MVITEVIQHPTVPLWLVQGTTYRGTKMLSCEAFLTREAAMAYAHAATGHGAPRTAPQPTMPVLHPSLTPVRPYEASLGKKPMTDIPDRDELIAAFGLATVLQTELTTARAAFADKPTPFNRYRLTRAERAMHRHEHLPVPRTAMPIS